MAWAGSVTDRGSASRCSSSGDISVTAFQPAADSLIIAICIVTEGYVVPADMSGHDSGTGWAVVDSFRLLTGSSPGSPSEYVTILAAHPGSSPTSEAVTLNNGDYHWDSLMSVLEITDVKTDGTIAESFGTPVDDDYVYNSDSSTITLASFQNSEGLTLEAWIADHPGTDNCSFDTSFTQASDANGCNGNGITTAYLGSEDNSVQGTAGGGWTHYHHWAVEVVGIAAGASPQTISVGVASEADSALTINPITDISVSVGVASETDSAQAITAGIGTNVSVGVASETDSALAIAASSNITVSVGFAEEVNAALTINPDQAGTVSVGVATETDTAQSVTPVPGTATVAVGVATETDTALAITGTVGNSVSVGVAEETDTALAITPVSGATTIAVGVASEVDTAHTINPSTPGTLEERVAAIETKVNLLLALRL